LVVLPAVLLAGCSVSPGSQLTLFPQGHRLTPAAKQMRSAHPEPVELPRELNKSVLTDYVVEPGDVLLVQPAEFDAPVRLPADQPVLPDGTINLGRYGRVLVAGRTVGEIERIVQAAVAMQTKNAGPITVRLIARQSKVFYVLGEVNAPGAYPLTGRETVLDGILAAGGLTDAASGRDIILSRPTPPNGCRVVLPVCYNDIVQLGDTATNYQLAPGDRIYVPTRHFFEGLFPFPRPECPPCHRPQVPCFLPPISPDESCADPPKGMICPFLDPGPPSPAGGSQPKTNTAPAASPATHARPNLGTPTTKVTHR
jgi:protein involved in polysaccharide export with SLBB domain